MNFKFRRRRKQNGGIVPGILFFVVGVLFAYFLGYNMIQEATASQDWPSTMGTVIETDIHTDRDDGKVYYTPLVVYQYSIDGQQYESSQLTLAGYTSSTRSQTAYKVIEAYPIGQQIEVFFHPKQPHNAILSTEVPFIFQALFWGGIVFAYLGLHLFFTGLFSLGKKLLQLRFA